MCKLWRAPVPATSQSSVLNRRCDISHQKMPNGNDARHPDGMRSAFKKKFAATFPSLGETLKAPTADARGAEGD
jgi:hypothetical protein